MCWPLTRRGGHTATTKETERPSPPGGPAGAMRRNDRAKEPPQRWRAGMIDAAHRWKARATAGCAQAPALKPQAGSRSSPARHGRAESTNEARRSASDRPKRLRPFAKMEESQRVGFEADLSLTRLSASRRPSTNQMVADRSRMLNGPGEVEGNLRSNRRHEIVRCATTQPREPVIIEMKNKPCRKRCLPIH